MATVAQTAPTSPLEVLAIEALVSHGQTVVDISSGGSEWLDAVFARCRNMRALLYASPEAEQSTLRTASAKESTSAQIADGDTHGTRLDADTRAKGVRHIHFLRIADAKSVQRVLKGAVGLLRHSRVDYI
jgi:hypothetical protein